MTRHRYTSFSYVPTKANKNNMRTIGGQTSLSPANAHRVGRGSLPAKSFSASPSIYLVVCLSFHVGGWVRVYVVVLNGGSFATKSLVCTNIVDFPLAFLS